MMGKHFLLIVFVAIQYGTIQGQTNDELLKIKYYEASELHKKKEYEASNRKLDEVEKLFGRNNLRIQYLRVKNYYALNNYDQTKRQIVEYIKLKPEEDDALHEILKYKAEIEGKEKIEQERLRAQREEQERLRLEKERHEKLMADKMKQYNLIITAIQNNQPNAMTLVNEYLRNNARNDIYYDELEEAKRQLILDSFYLEIKRLTEVQNKQAALKKCHEYLDKYNVQKHRSYTEIVKLCKDLQLGFIEYGEFIDQRDGKKYRTIKIDKTTWLADNLEYKPKDGYFYPNNDKNNVAKYGYLYNWKTACSVCPVGWHLSTNQEWTDLINFVGVNANTKLKANMGYNRNNSTDSKRWKLSDGSDEFSFSLYPAGSVNENYFDDFGSAGFFWSSTLDTTQASTKAFYRLIDYRSKYENLKVTERSYDPKIGFSVRCVKN